MTSRRLALLWAIGAASTPVPRAAHAQDPRPGVQRTIVPPRLVKFVDAEFPEAEKAAGKGAVVVLQIAIAATGAVAQVAVEKSAGAAFDRAAVAAAQQFVFDPATAGGTPIPVRIAYRYEFVWREEYEKKTTADFKGTVRDGKTRTPIAGATVTLDARGATTTDARGHFSLKDVAPGEHAVTIAAPGFPKVSTSEVFEAGKRVTATYEILPAAPPRPPSKPGGKEGDEEEEIVVTAPRIQKQIVSIEVQSNEARRVPGTQGDVLKVVENLPGVARASVGSGQLVVWGAAPEDTRVYLEGMRIPRLYHDGGYRSVIHSDLVRSVELVPGGYGPAYGRGLGGLVAVTLRPLDEPGVHGSAAVDVIDAAASVRARVTDRLQVAAAVRRSHLDEAVRAVTSKDVGDVAPIPRYWDSQLRVRYALGSHETVEAGAIASSDAIDRALARPDPAESKRESRRTSFWRVYANYDKRLEDGAVIRAMPSFGADRSRLVSRFGATPTELDQDTTIFGFRTSYRGPVRKWLGVHVGFDAEVSASVMRRAGSIGAPAREGDIRVFGQAPSDQTNVDDWKTVIATLAPFAEADIALAGDRLHLIPGVRIEPYVVAGSRATPRVGDTPGIGYSREDTVVAPRFSVRYSATPRVSVKAAVGVYHQAPAPDDLSAVFGNPSLGLSVARHALAGGAVKLTDLLSAELTGFLSVSESLTVRSPAPAPALGHALVQDGRGRSFGAQLLLRHEQRGRFFGWLSYSMIRSARADSENGPLRLFDYDQTHVLTALGAYDLGAGFEVGARLRVASGFPRTPVARAYYDARTDSYQPLFGPHNTDRIPAFFAVDVRAARRFRIGRSEAEIYLDVQNVTNHKNAEEIVYSTAYTQRGYIAGLPILPVFGARLSW